MKKLLSSVMILLLMAAGLGAAAQPKPGYVVNGRVTSFDESLPLEGARILIKGSVNGTGTQADGTFSLPIGPGDSILVVSLNGYEAQEVKLAARSRQYDVVLKRKDNAYTSRNTQDNYWPSSLPEKR